MAKPAEKIIGPITIDGPSGSGKSTAARLLAQRLGVAYLDTGAMYRAATLKALRLGLDLMNSSELIEMVKVLDLDLLPAAKNTKVLLDRQDVSEDIRTVAVTDNAHFLASRRGVRAQMVKRQRSLAKKLGPLVAEGRDQGTVVFPKAQVKFFLEADAAVRARRRYQQMQKSGEKVCYEQVLEGMETRDGRDRNRQTAPLEIPAGAIVIDTTDLTIEQMVDQMAQHVERLLSSQCNENQKSKDPTYPGT